MFKNSCSGANDQFEKRKIIIAGDSLLNGISKKRLSKNHSVMVNNMVLGDFLKNKPDSFIVHADTNDVTKGKTLLNNVKKS